MTTAEAIQMAGIERRSSEWLLAALINKDRSWVLAHPDDLLSSDQEKKWAEWCKRADEEEPFEYIIGSQEFYGRSFVVNADVLIPRLSTEGLIDIVKGVGVELGVGPNPNPLDNGIVGLTLLFEDIRNIDTIVDIGTGSGCIAITLALERPNMKVIATDISESALKVAFINAKNHRVEDRISFQKGNLMEPISDLKEPFLIVSNPPYIPSDAKVGSDVEKFEPHSALFAGAGGLDVILPLVEAASKHPFCQGIVLECREDQVETIQKIPVFS